MNEKEFNLKAQEMVGITGVDLIVTKTTENITYDGITYFRFVLAFDVRHEGTTLLTINLKRNGDLEKVEWNNQKDKAYAMAQVDVLNRLFKGTKHFYIKGLKNR